MAVSVELVTLTDSVVNVGEGIGIAVVSRSRVMLDFSLQSLPAKPSSQKHTMSVVHT